MAAVTRSIGAPVSTRPFAPSESICSRVYRAVCRVFESIIYVFDKIRLWRWPSRFESKLIPTTIPNQGNTCFAAAWMQVVASNSLLAGAYRSTLHPSFLGRLFGSSHCAVQVLTEYRNRQHNGESSRIDISHLRSMFNGPSAGSPQEDAAELALKIQGQMVMPANGEVTLEDGSKAGFGCRMQRWSRSEQAWIAQETDRAGVDVYSAPVLSLSLLEKGSSNLASIIRENYWSDPTFVRFTDLPNTLVFNLTRHSFAGATAQANARKVNAPLYLSLPSPMLGGKASPKYMLQGFVSHDLGSAAGGHYVAYVHAAGRFYKMNDGIRTEIRIGDYLRAAKTAYTLNYSRA